MKNILFFHPSSDLYGSDKILIYILKYFNQYKINLILKSDGPLVELIKSQLPQVNIVIINTLPIIAKKNISPAGLLEFIKSLFLFKKEIRKYYNKNTEYVYLNTLAVLPVLFFFQKQNIKKLFHVHETLVNNNFLHKIINKTALKYADQIICVSEAVSKNILQAAPTLSYKVQVVHNGISFSQSEVKEHLEVDNTKINFALIGRLKPRIKGQLLLIEALGKLTEEEKQKTHFYFIGSCVEGEEFMLDDINYNIKKQNLSNIITIVPFIKNIEKAYNSIDVVLVPSLVDDSFPTTVLEGMFFSKPVIGTRVGGIPEMIIDKQTGFISDRGDSEDLKENIKKIIANPELIEKMGAEGKKRFETNFTEELFYKRLQSVFA